MKYVSQSLTLVPISGNYENSHLGTDNKKLDLGLNRQFKFDSVTVAVWPTFGTELSARLTQCSILFVILVISRFCFEGRVWVLIPTVPGHS